VSILPPFRAALFDMDGTLVDSTAAVEEIWSDFAQRHGLDVTEILAIAHGVRAGDTIARVLPAGSDLAAAQEEFDRHELANQREVTAIPGAAGYLEGLRAAGVPFAIVTSASRELALARLGAAGIPVPEVLVSAADVVRGKPDPEGYLLAAARLDVPIADCVIFEDAEAGIRAGLSAGGSVVVVGDATGEATVGLPRIRDFGELLGRG
jgi:sugar-phosphatase